MTTELTQNTIEIDGYILDSETGEIFGLAKQEFQVTDEKSADFLRRSWTEVEIVTK